MRKSIFILLPLILMVISSCDRHESTKIIAPLPAKPSATILVNATSVWVNETITLSWTSANAKTCSASGNWSGQRPLQGQETIQINTTGSLRYVITCYSENFHASAEVSVDANKLNFSSNYPLEVEDYDFNFYEYYDFSKITVSEILRSEDTLWGIEQINSELLAITKQKVPTILIYNINENKIVKSFSLSQLNISTSNQGGVFDMKHYFDGNVEYLFFLASTGSTLTRTSLFRLDLRTNEIVHIYDFDEYGGTGHYGGAIEIIDGRIFISSGDKGYRSTAQDFLNDNGSIVQINLDGTVEEFNLYNTDWKNTIFAAGIRNTQSIGYIELHNILFSSEHGPKGGDEINILSGGLNYGWPIVSLGREYSNDEKIGVETLSGYEDPLFYFIPSIAPRGIVYVGGDYKVPELRNSFLIASLKYQMIVQLKITSEKPEPKILFKWDGGRISDLAVVDEGIYFVTHNFGTDSTLNFLSFNG